MPAPSRKTAAKIRRMLELQEAGASSRQIAEEIGVTDTTVRNWLEDKGLEANGRGGRQRTKPRPRLTEEERSAARSAAEALVGADDMLPSDPTVAGRIVMRRLQLLQSVLDELTPAMRENAYPPGAWGTLVKLEGELAARLAELAPPAPPDPERDPTNVEAAQAVRERLSRLVASAEKTARCVHCGQPPFASRAP